MKLIIFFVSELFIASLSGCETQEGFAKDVRSLGGKIQKKASTTG